MIGTEFEYRVKAQHIVQNQLPEFILDESPNAVEFLKQYYISQEYQGGPVDIADNLDQYLKLDNLTPEVIVGSVGLTTNIDSNAAIITVTSTKGFPQKYGLLKIDDEVITYTGITTNTFTGCIRGFSGITNYHQDLNSEELVFSESKGASHTPNTSVQNLSSLFLKEFYVKLKSALTPGLENTDFVSDLNVGNFIKNARSFYQSKGTDESFRILFNVLYGVTPKVVNLEDYLIKPSSAEFIRREVVVAEAISGDPTRLVGQTIKKYKDDIVTSASVSEVETFSRRNKQYFKISLFVGYDEFSAVEGNFGITPNTKCLEDVEIGSSVISVDSTVAFPESGTIFSGDNVISYTNKSVNQFFNCTGIGHKISLGDDIRSDEIYYGYENGDTTKKVELRLTGILSKLVQISESLKVSEGDDIFVKNLGEIIKNPIENKSYKQIFANSWIYNTSSRYQIKNILGSAFVLGSSIDRSSLKVGDRVEIVDRGTSEVVSQSSNLPYISVVVSDTQVNLNNLSGFVPTDGKEYDLRRKINKASSSIVPIEFGNNAIISDIQNVYNENDEYMYVASNSLPSHNNDLQIPYSYQITKDICSLNVNGLDKNNIDSSGRYYILLFNNSVPFINGDRVYYSSPKNSTLDLETGSYYVEVLYPGNKIRLYGSKAFVGTDQYLTFTDADFESQTHTLTLYSQKSATISAQKLLRKYPLNPNIKNGKHEVTIPGSIGMLINGVEIKNYKSDDKIYYGPLKSINVLSNGSDYDVINPPLLSVSSGEGTDALAQLVVRGSIEKVYVDPQEFDIDKITSINITGGNGKNAAFEPILKKRLREVYFDARVSYGINITNETIKFLTDHNFKSGDKIIYNSNGNLPLGIGNYGGSNDDQDKTLTNNATYYAKVDNNITIRLYSNFSDYSSGINTIGFTTTNTSGVHKFSTAEGKNTISEIKVINGGNNYTNRKLIVPPTGVSTSNYTINFTNHGFNDGELVVYDYQTSPISGISSTNQYYILKFDDNSFRLCDAGIGGTSPTKYNRKNYVKFTSTGSGYQYFNYPKISVSIQYSSVGSTVEQEIIATPVVKGNIIDCYLYESGTGYGSTVLNFHKKPLVQIRNGKEAQISPVIFNGFISTVSIKYGGYDYYSVPDLIVEDLSGSGSGAELRAIITNNKITGVSIINTGAGYSDKSTVIKVKPAGSGAKFDSTVRSLRVNNTSRFGSELLIESDNMLQYSICGYYNTLRLSLKDDGSQHSPIIGWAYDGNPIYGSYGYSNKEDANTQRRALISGYELNVSNIIDRPPSFAAGFFVEDYQYTNSGDLDENNGRFGKTPEFPNGVYAYFAPIDELTSEPKFPYFIGDTYRSNSIKENFTINQTYDFNNSNLLRNTFPYKISEIYANNDFIIESNEILNQKTVIESITNGYVNSIDILNPGYDYKVNDILKFDNTGTEGSGLSAKISSLKGKDIVKIDTSIETYDDAIFTWKDDTQVKVSILPNNNLLDNDYIIVSGFSTNLSQLNGEYRIGITSYYSNLLKDIPEYIPEPGSSVGLTTEIYVTQLPHKSVISIGSSIKIGTETLSVLELFKNLNIMKVQRGSTGISHSASTPIYFIPDSFTISKNIDYFKSELNSKVYFNPTESIGIGTEIGITTSITLEFGDSNITKVIPTQGIYIEDHPFKTNQKIIFRKPDENIDNISVSTSPTGATFNIEDSQIFYAVNKNNNTIGLKTSVNSSELFFVDLNGGNNDDKYSFESTYPQIVGKVKRIVSTVSVSTSHGLSNEDTISLTVKPNFSVGIGTSTSVYVKRNPTSGNILINPIGFSSSGINTSTSIITINSHNLNTGDKVYYSSDLVASGLKSDFYYVYKITDNEIKLSETYSDCKNIPPINVSIVGTGGTNQFITQINPQIKVTRNNDLVFNLSDSSLDGYKFKIYYDQEFNNEFVSTATTSGFTLSGVGTVGISSTASLTINYDSSLPTKLYYTLEKDGSTVAADTELNNYSEILFTDSTYNSNYNVFGIGSTTFDISLSRIPEKLSYSQEQCEVLEYVTHSLSAKGPIDKINIISGGTDYKKLPVFSTSDSVDGKDAYIIPKSKTIGNIKNVRIVNEGFEYSPDKTLQPFAYISPLVTIENSDTIGIITVTSGGTDYTSPPSIIIVDNISGEKIDNGVLEAVLSDNTISSVNIIQNPKGLPSTTVRLAAINNTNGVSIQSVESSNTGIFTCYITTPILGYSTPPFSVGDKVFVEGIVKNGTTGTGFNCEDYGYEFFTVSNYQASNPDKVIFNISELTSNAGSALEIQDSFASIINSKNYPSFEIIQKPSYFLKGEKIISNGIERDLIIKDSTETFIKVFGSYELSPNEIIKGKQSGNIATIRQIENNLAIFKIDYSVERNNGWLDDIGKLDYDNQVIPDNDYYQNLSYTIKSPIEYEDLKTTVNNLLHSSGTKNFADTGITSSTSAYVSGSTVDSIILDLLNEERVDIIYNFDLVKDIDIITNSSSKLSKTLKLKNITLTNFIKCENNVVLGIDDISGLFSNLETSPSEYLNILKLNKTDTYYNIIFRISSLDNSQLQLTELSILNNSIDTFVLTKSSISNIGFTAESLSSDQSLLGNFSVFTDEFDDSYLRFNPTNSYDIDYDLKIIKTKFNTILPGITGTQSIGFVDLTGLNIGVQSGTTSPIVSTNANKLESLYADIEVINSSTNEMNFVEIYLTHDGKDTYISEYYIDSESQTNNYSNNLIGSFSSNISSGGVLSLNFNNTTESPVRIRSRIVGFGSTSIGIGTYRFKQPGEISGNERSAKYESTYQSNVSSASTTIISLNKDNFNALKSLVKVSFGSTIALHQVSLLQDVNNIFVEQSAFLSVGNAIGIGTFGGEYSENNFELKFYKSPEITDTINISAFNQCIYTAIDDVNIPPDLNYGSLTDSIQVSSYNAINGNRINKTEFTMRYDGIPIFAKTFNPSNSNPLDGPSLNQSTGLFTINNHFFSNGERLIYTAKSTYVGINATPLMVGGTPLPLEVYAIVEDANNFKLALTKDDAISGNNVTFVPGSGDGNAHQLEMYKKNEKALITLNNVVQYPLILTSTSHNLSGNGGEISIGSSIFALSGISTIMPNDILKIDNENMKIENVGFGTTNTGPITNIGTIPLVQVSRGFVGSSASTHTDSTEATIYKGAYNIVENKIHFVEAPRGNPQIILDDGNLPFQTSDFNGRVFLRNDYTTNAVYDDISNKFTGIGRTFTLTIGGINTVGLGSTGGNGILFINNVYQTPTTDNNPNNNFKIIENSVTGITSVVFSGVQDKITKDIITSKFDVNQNQTPRGGIIVSFGSSTGLGYAPLVGASVTAVVGAGGSIVSIGIGTTTGSCGSGYNGIVSIGVSVYESGHTGNVADIRASVGAGGTLSFTVDSGGTGYTNPKIFVSEPSYQNLEVVGVSRLGIGTTTDTGVGLLMNVVVGASSTTGIGSTFFEVTGFNISRQGYSFQRGDVFAPVGLVTDSRLSSPLSKFSITVLDTFTDSFAAWQFGELDYIDSVLKYQDGSRKRFPLFYNSQLLSFEKVEDSLVKLDNCLLIFINGIVQEPGVAYEFEGGTSFSFTTAPKKEDNVAIFFYRGTKGQGGDSELVTNVKESLKEGDTVRVLKNNTIPGTISQGNRTISNLKFSDRFETDLYSGNEDIDTNNYKPLSWVKQKTDKTVNGQIIYKSRDSIESLVYPTAKVIKDLSLGDNEIFVDDVNFFDYGDATIETFDALIIDGKDDPISASLTATVSAGGTISELQIINGGSGYTGSSVIANISAPLTVGVLTSLPMGVGIGIGTVAKASITVSPTGTLTTPITITNPGLGYSTGIQPQVIVPLPNPTVENINVISVIEAFSGIITGITTTTGIGGNPLAIKFFVKSSTFDGLNIGYPIYIFNTCVGNGITSINNSDLSIVGIGESYLDNIYYINDIDSFASNGSITCNILSSSTTIGIETTGSISNPAGKFSLGRMSAFSRPSPIEINVSGNTVNSGLSTFPTIQRRNSGLRQTGALIKTILPTDI